MAFENVVIDEKTNAAHSHVEDALGYTAIEDAKNASDAEHAQTFLQAIKANRKAVFWSALISMSIVMEGYDTILMGNFFGYPAFQRKYGKDFGGDTGYQVTGPWQAGLSNASNCGTVIGIAINGWASARFGYRKVMLVSLFFMNAFIFITFFAPTVEVLCVGQVLCGTWFQSYYKMCLTFLRSRLGCIRNHRPCVRVRGHTIGVEGVPDNVQLNLKGLIKNDTNDT